MSRKKPYFIYPELPNPQYTTSYSYTSNKENTDHATNNRCAVLYLSEIRVDYNTTARYTGITKYYQSSVTGTT